MASFDKCFCFDCFSCFFKGINLSTMQSISLCKIFQHSVAVLFFSVLFSLYLQNDIFKVTQTIYLCKNDIFKMIQTVMFGDTCRTFLSVSWITYMSGSVSMANDSTKWTRCCQATASGLSAPKTLE